MSQASFVRRIAKKFPKLEPIFEEHLEDNFGETLPHLFVAELTRYLLSLSSVDESATTRPNELNEILGYLEDAYSGGDDEVQELISVSFLENLPRPGEAGDQIRHMIGPRLKEQLNVIG